MNDNLMIYYNRHKLIQKEKQIMDNSYKTYYNSLTNLYDELNETMNHHGLKQTDISYIIVDNKEFPKDAFMNLIKVIDYYSGFGGAEITTNIKIIFKDAIITREEYDGSEWWKYISLKRPLEYTFDFDDIVKGCIYDY